MRKRETEGWPEEKRARCGCGWGARGRVEGESWSLETGPCGARSVGNRLFRLGAGDARAKGEKKRHGAATQLGANFLGPSLGEWILVSSLTKKGLLCLDIANTPCVIALVFHECATTLIRSRTSDV